MARRANFGKLCVAQRNNALQFRWPYLRSR